MRTVQIPVFKYSELSDRARQEARYNYECGFGYVWAGEAMSSLKAFAHHFYGKLKDWSIDWTGACSPSYVRFEWSVDWEPEALAVRRQQASELTGFCADEDLWTGFDEAWAKGERDMNQLAIAAYRRWLESAIADYNGFYSDEVFAEHAEANEYEYYANGRRYP